MRVAEPKPDVVVVDDALGLRVLLESCGQARLERLGGRGAAGRRRRGPVGALVVGREAGFGHGCALRVTWSGSGQADWSLIGAGEFEQYFPYRLDDLRLGELPRTGDVFERSRDAASDQFQQCRLGRVRAIGERWIRRLRDGRIRRTDLLVRPPLVPVEPRRRRFVVGEPQPGVVMEATPLLLAPPLPYAVSGVVVLELAVLRHETAPAAAFHVEVLLTQIFHGVGLRLPAKIEVSLAVHIAAWTGFVGPHGCPAVA